MDTNERTPPIPWNALTTRLRPFIGRRVGTDEADDVLQDVLLRMHQSLPSLRERDHLPAWMFRIARNSVADHLRKRARDPARPMKGDDPFGELQAPSPELDETAITSALANALDTLIDELPERYRSAIRLTEIQGLTQRQMGEQLGLGLSGAKSRVQRGREKLRDLIEDCCRVALDARGKLIDCQPRSAADGCCE